MDISGVNSREETRVEEALAREKQKLERYKSGACVAGMCGLLLIVVSVVAGLWFAQQNPSGECETKKNCILPAKFGKLRSTASGVCAVGICIGVVARCRYLSASCRLARLNAECANSPGSQCEPLKSPGFVSGAVFRAVSASMEAYELRDSPPDYENVVSSVGAQTSVAEFVEDWSVTVALSGENNEPPPSYKAALEIENQANASNC